MAKQVNWTVPIYEEYISLVFMSDFQRDVMDLHVRRKTDIQIARELHCSESSVQRAIRECKNMYDAVQPFSRVLPKRRLTEKEKKATQYIEF